MTKEEYIKGTLSKYPNGINSSLALDAFIRDCWERAYWLGFDEGYMEAKTFDNINRKH